MLSRREKRIIGPDSSRRGNSGAGLFAGDFDEDTLRAETVEFGEVGELPGAELELAFGETDDLGVIEEQGPQMRVGGRFEAALPT